MFVGLPTCFDVRFVGAEVVDTGLGNGRLVAPVDRYQVVNL